MPTTVTLSPELDKFVGELVQSGKFAHENVRKTRLYQAMESVQTLYDSYFPSPFEGNGIKLRESA
jgi:hypothetical protein